MNSPQEHTELQRLRAERDHLMRQNMVLRNRVAELEKGCVCGARVARALVWAKDNPPKSSDVNALVQQAQTKKEQDR